VKTLGFTSFILRFIFRRERFGILWARGGLGNQLFQISALSFFSSELHFSPVIHPTNLRYARDGFKPQYRNLSIEEFFSPDIKAVDPSLILELFLKLLYKLYLKFFRSGIYDESKLLLSNNSSLPNLFFIQDFFENQQYPNRLSNRSLTHLFRKMGRSEWMNVAPSCSLAKNSTMIHIRLTDSHNQADICELLLRADIMMRNGGVLKENSTIDVYSDDLPLAKKLLDSTFVWAQKHYPEESKEFSSAALLEQFSRYDQIIASKSTLSWWACFLKSKLTVEQGLILADFDSKLMRDGWLKI
jgi:hypothetical protein